MGFWGRDEDAEEAAARIAEAEADEQPRKERVAQLEAETGYRSLASELYRPSWLLCTRCGLMAQDREMHDEWHRSMGQEWTPTAA